MWTWYWRLRKGVQGLRPTFEEMEVYSWVHSGFPPVLYPSQGGFGANRLLKPMVRRIRSSLLCMVRSLCLFWNGTGHEYYDILESNQQSGNEFNDVYLTSPNEIDLGFHFHFTNIEGRFTSSNGIQPFFCLHFTNTANANFSAGLLHWYKSTLLSPFPTYLNLLSIPSLWPTAPRT